ncbi:tRNA (5-methylaminomethyl-2-thiouridine)(34)-methyltransferase MnmD [Luteithermobacter gelatinilyticus]|uniref:tRNA (5-methylaminomethyl-2-thiouridine)(34)-methyltransferase MnmD n=1 Tax=Luteithermobacter gelatinilyticus TaxID=2582913 RepID=UPI00110723ED|nr:tRNA (5-methylaminomethyl-2-thiouridine)(34)-methyltransferase MnmD [Luteithermobacter gelatinilyticus]
MNRKSKGQLHKPAQDLEWQAEDTPASRRFRDIYFSPEDGLEESRYVFLDGIGTPDIWRGQRHFCIGETGFGTGLNFLNTVRLWHETSDAEARLTYISAEKYPLQKDDIRRALSRWPDLYTELSLLSEAYPGPVPGYHSLELPDRRVRLLLLVGDAAKMLAEVEGGLVDAWYLDGFAPSRNPDMWSPALFKEIGRLSAPNARLATFTAAGFVRRGLEDVGFEMHKHPGFGQKRECLRGRYAGPLIVNS